MIDLVIHYNNVGTKGKSLSEIEELVKEEMPVVFNDAIRMYKREGVLDTNKVSDGYHTFGELYEHRITLFIALCRVLEDISPHFTDRPLIWKSRHHSDGSEIKGWFVMGINKEKGVQITYHLPDSKWDECKFAKTLEKAPEFDGHTSADVLERLKHL